MADWPIGRWIMDNQPDSVAELSRCQAGSRPRRITATPDLGHAGSRPRRIPATPDPGPVPKIPGARISGVRISGVKTALHAPQDAEGRPAARGPPNSKPVSPQNQNRPGTGAQARTRVHAGQTGARRPFRYRCHRDRAVFPACAISQAIRRPYPIAHPLVAVLLAPPLLPRCLLAEVRVLEEVRPPPTAPVKRA